MLPTLPELLSGARESLENEVAVAEEVAIAPSPVDVFELPQRRARRRPDPSRDGLELGVGGHRHDVDARLGCCHVGRHGRGGREQAETTEKRAVFSHHVPGPG